MSLRRKFEKRIAEHEEEIASIELKLAEKKAYLSALKDSLKMLPKEDDEASADIGLREGSVPEKVRQYLQQQGEPKRIKEIIEGIGIEYSKKVRQSVTSSLGAYVRKGIIFTRPHPGMYGLKEFENKTGSVSTANCDEEDASLDEEQISLSVVK